MTCMFARGLNVIQSSPYFDIEAVIFEHGRTEISLQRDSMSPLQKRYIFNLQSKQGALLSADKAAIKSRECCRTEMSQRD